MCFDTVVLVLISCFIALNRKWDLAYGKANATLARYTLQDKVNLTTGIGWEAGPCVGNIAAVNRPWLVLPLKH
jgi:hypothetical protein